MGVVILVAKVVGAIGLALWLVRFLEKPTRDLVNDARERSGLPRQSQRSVRFVVFVGLAMVAFLVASAFVN